MARASNRHAPICWSFRSASTNSIRSERDWTVEKWREHRTGTRRFAGHFAAHQQTVSPGGRSGHSCPGVSAEGKPGGKFAVAAFDFIWCRGAGAADCVREYCEFAAGARDFTAAGNGGARGEGREPLAAGAPIAHGKYFARAGGRGAGVDG